ncbi:MAG TPA: hypothetical protein VG675_11725 [Bryobacteraceae bacterium]|nr:hypothetical protein [Bryobacteraceae bacterium]
MHRIPATFALAFLLCPLSLPAGEAAPVADNSSPHQKAGSNRKANVTKLTGCVDERDGGYVLVDDQSLRPIVSLEAEGFPNEGFAKYLGHTVTVQGKRNSQGATPVFEVHTIQTVKDSCAPQAPQQ